MGRFTFFGRSAYDGAVGQAGVFLLSISSSGMTFVMPFRGSVRTLLWGAWLFLPVTAPLAIGADLEAPRHRIEIGWSGRVVLGRWNTAVVTLTDAAAGTYRIDVTATDPDGNLATFAGADLVADAGLLRLAGRFQLGRPDGSLTLRVLRDGVEWQTFGPYSPESNGLFHTAQTQAELFLITVGLPENQRSLFDPPALGRRTTLHLKSPSELPTDELAYDAVAGLLLAGPEAASEAHAATIDRWVRRGGRLFLSVGTPTKEYRESALFPRLPFDMEPEPVPTRELTSLESYAGKTVRILPPGLRVMIPKISVRNGRILAGSRSDAVLVQAPHGFGQITLLGLDVTQAPLSDWKDSEDNLLVGDLLRKMTDASDSTTSATSRGSRLGSTGVTEMASQLSAGLEQFDSVRRTSPWWVMAGLIAVMLLVGPLDYWLTARLSKRPLGTWISFPILLAACAAATGWAAGSANGGRFRFNQLDIVDLDIASDTARSGHFVTLYSPRAQACQVQIDPRWTAWTKGDSDPETSRASWSGLPEASFGGMYRGRSGALQFQQSEYEFAAGGNKAAGLPLAQWSTATLQLQTEAIAGNLVEAKLASNATGRLSGTIRHRLPGPLTGWFLAFSGRIYRLPVSDGAEEVMPLEPGQLWRVEQQNVVQRELRGFLTRTQARKIAGKGNAVRSDFILQQANYDPLRRDLKEILPALTFFAEIGGSAYTGLTNNALAEHDFTPLVSLDRAILFGYVDEAAASVSVSGADDAASNRTTLVRMVLPVDRSKQAVRELIKLDKQ